MAALVLDQAKLYMRDGAPVAYVSWAKLSEEVAQRYPWVHLVPSNIGQALESAFNQSKFYAAPPVDHFSTGINIPITESSRERRQAYFGIARASDVAMKAFEDA